MIETPAKLTKEEEEKIARRLLKRAEEAVAYFNVPEWYEIKYEGAKPHIIGGHSRHSLDSPDFFIRNKRFATASHILRVALDSVALGDILGIGARSPFSDSGAIFLESAIEHDRGKALGNIIEIAEKTEGFSEKDRETMKQHVWMSLSFQNGDVKAIVADHHRWQRQPFVPYPPVKNFFNRLLGRHHLVRTERSVALSKLLAILDFHDSAATRANTRNSPTPRLPAPEELKTLLLNEYGQMKINYSGYEMPEIHMRGEDVIHVLYAQGVFGRKDPFDPYPGPYSFIKRFRAEEALPVIESVKRREAEVTEKIRKYNEVQRRENELEERREQAAAKKSSSLID